MTALIPLAIPFGDARTFTPLTKLSMFSERPPTSEATTQRPALHASVRISPNGSFLLGMATMSAALRSLMKLGSSR